jgi:Domain of unknown function (DUF932)/Tetratricopeptide repeat
LYSTTMPHSVESMMYAGQVPWHGLGTPVSTEVTAGDAIKHAGLSWHVDLQPVFAGAGLVQSLVAGVKATVRNTDQRALGVVGDRYMPVQNEDAFAFFDSVVGEGQAIYHTAGSLDGGRRVWVLAKLPGEVRLHQDEVTEKYLLLMNSHDGSTALRMLFTPVRVVCQNTLNLAMRGTSAEGIAIRHTACTKPKAVEPKVGLTLALLAAGNWKALDIACRDALTSLPADPDLRARLASAQYNLGRFPDAAVLYRKLIDDYPAMLDYQTGYGWALQRMGKRKEAEAIFRSVLAVSPDNVNAQQGLAAR